MIRTSRKVLSALVVGLLWLALPTSVEPSQFDKKTIFTINRPMWIPGMVLEPGTYVVKLVSSMSDRNTVQFWNEDETYLYTTVRAISKERTHPVDRAELTFEAHSPLALKTWFYPGELAGWEFTYPERDLEEMAMATGQPEIQTPPVATMAPEPKEPESVMAEPEESAMAAPAAPPREAAAPPTAEPSPAEPEPSPAQEEAMQPEAPAAAEELPETASPLPLLLLLGIASLAVGGLVRVIARRIS